MNEWRVPPNHFINELQQWQHIRDILRFLFRTIRWNCCNIQLPNSNSSLASINNVNSQQGVENAFWSEDISSGFSAERKTWMQPGLPAHGGRGLAQPTCRSSNRDSFLADQSLRVAFLYRLAASGLLRCHLESADLSLLPVTTTSTSSS